MHAASLGQQGSPGVLSLWSLLTNSQPNPLPRQPQTLWVEYGAEGRGLESPLSCQNLDGQEAAGWFCHHRPVCPTSQRPESHPGRQTYCSVRLMFTQQGERVFHGLSQFSVVWCGVMRCGVVWCGVVWGQSGPGQRQPKSAASQGSLTVRLSVWP